MDRDLELLSDIELYDMYSEGLTFSDPDFVFMIPVARERIARKIKKAKPSSHKDLTRLERADIYVLSNLRGLPDDYDMDDPSQPLEKWWWHLRAIKEGKFPKEFLPLSNPQKNR